MEFVLWLCVNEFEEWYDEKSIDFGGILILGDMIQGDIFKDMI